VLVQKHLVRGLTMGASSDAHRRRETPLADLSSITVANAPVSYGAFELTVGIDPSTPDGLHVLDEVAAAGYAGIDLGPVGYLGSGPELADRLASRGLGLAGAYLELPYADADALEKVLPELDAMLDTFDAVAGRLPGPPPHPTIADAGVPQRRAAGRAHADRSWGSTTTAGAVRRWSLPGPVRCRDRGYEPTFHNETGTFVEAPWEVERVLDLTDAQFCLDTGHFVVGGGDPVAALREFGSRINQVHLKDASRDVVAAIVADGDPVEAVWSREAFPRLGAGDVDIDAFLAVLRDTGWSGWLVVEQDTLPTTFERFARAAEDQRANRAFLSARGL
jgi:inosose dehydratase